MTAKLKKKLKLIGLTVIAVVTIGTAVFTANSSDLFSMHGEIETQKDQTASGTYAQSNVQILGDTIICDSLVQGVRDVNLPDGTYTFRVRGKTSNGTEETKDYLVELKNEYNDVTYTSNQSLGDTSKEYKTLIVKYHKNLTINSGVKVTANTSTTKVSNVNYELCYKKGMFLCVMGEFVNNGTVSMTARGTYTSEAGENVYLWKNIDGNYEYVPANGGNGLPAAQIVDNRGIAKATSGNNGANRGTGGGGMGGGRGHAKCGYVGPSTGGTSYAGGNGSGGLFRCNLAAIATSATQASAVKGGNGSAANSGSTSYFFAGGGAGQIGGTTSRFQIGTSGIEARAEDGTGGLLIVYAGTLQNNGTISSNGSKGAGGKVTFSQGDWRGATGGGGSGRRLSKYLL